MASAQKSSLAGGLPQSPPQLPKVVVSSTSTPKGFDCPTTHQRRGFSDLGYLSLFTESTIGAIRNAHVLLRLARIKAFIARNYLSEKPAPKELAIIEDLLDLSKNGHHPLNIRKSALRLILRLIVEGRIIPLIGSIVRWSPEEIRSFFVEIMACLPDDWVTACRSNMHRELQSTYTSLVSNSFPGMRHGATYFLDLVTSICRQSQIAAHAILDAGILAMLVNCVTRVRDMSRPHESSVKANKRLDSLISSSLNVLSTLAVCPTCRTRIVGSPLYKLWPTHTWHDLNKMGLESWIDGGPKLPYLQSPILLCPEALSAPILRHPEDPLHGILNKENFDMICAIFSDHSLSSQWLIDHTMSSELFKLAGFSAHAEASLQAVGILIKCITMRMDLWNTFQEVLFISDIDVVQCFFSHLIKWCMADTSIQSKYGVTYEDIASPHTCPSVDPWERCLAFAIASGTQKQPIVQALVRVGIVNLALFVPNDVFRFPSFELSEEDVSDWQAVLYEIVHFYSLQSGDKLKTTFSLEFLFTIDHSYGHPEPCAQPETDFLSLCSDDQEFRAPSPFSNRITQLGNTALTRQVIRMRSR
ncbi:hypothetical protein BJ138DRAFT_1182221 [Hygrophoropsis aurantiaca]|uniref:Uncharacterized protein n=1 Tax=Hygrophoropsis aurantiaca TaxID=72124 RepID=A0ACB8A2W3_9AGAM|nr:hypothetical protein BJ138DRAFT_1182221 [Hygrophoropsis aurantiaca]